MPLCTGGGIPSRQEGERLEREQEERGRGIVAFAAACVQRVCVCMPVWNSFQLSNERTRKEEEEEEKVR